MRWPADAWLRVAELECTNWCSCRSVHFGVIPRQKRTDELEWSPVLISKPDHTPAGQGFLLFRCRFSGAAASLSTLRSTPPESGRAKAGRRGRPQQVSYARLSPGWALGALDAGNDLGPRASHGSALFANQHPNKAHRGAQPAAGCPTGGWRRARCARRRRRAPANHAVAWLGFGRKRHPSMWPPLTLDRPEGPARIPLLDDLVQLDLRLLRRRREPAFDTRLQPRHQDAVAELLPARPVRVRAAQCGLRGRETESHSESSTSRHRRSLCSAGCSSLPPSSLGTT